MKYLTKEEILLLHYKVIEDFGGSHGIRDENRLKSLIEAPKQKVFGQSQYKSVYEKAAVYLRNTISDHMFVDGNKRTALACAGIFLTRNNHPLVCNQKDLEEFIIYIAKEKPTIKVIATWLKEHTK